jgi:hypothetical protein
MPAAILQEIVLRRHQATKIQANRENSIEGNPGWFAPQFLPIQRLVE